MPVCFSVFCSIAMLFLLRISTECLPRGGPCERYLYDGFDGDISPPRCMYMPSVQHLYFQPRREESYPMDKCFLFLKSFGIGSLWCIFHILSYIVLAGTQFPFYVLWNCFVSTVSFNAFIAMFLIIRKSICQIISHSFGFALSHY